MATKSDVKAKQAFIAVLKSNGFNSAKIISSPADIVAWKDGVRYYFEIKMTKQTETYFGAATLTEWQSAMANPGTYFFVLAVTDNDETYFKFKLLTPEEFMLYSSIPPFKLFFNIQLPDLFSAVDKKHELDTEIDISATTDITTIVKAMNNNANSDEITVKDVRNKATKLTAENIKKMIVFYNELIENQRQKN